VFSHSHSSLGKPINITYSECVSTALFIQHAKLKCHIILSPMACPPLPNFTTWSHKRNAFQNKSKRIWIVCFDFLCKFIWNISHSKKNWARYDKTCVLVFMYNTGYSCQIVVKIEYSRHIFEKSSDIKFHENLSSGRQTFMFRSKWEANISG
jgi:hypothetical protein